jgi:hypothetical protein
VIHANTSEELPANNVEERHLGSALQDGLANACTDCASTTRYCEEVLVGLQHMELFVTLSTVWPSSLKRSLVATTVGAGNVIIGVKFRI